MFQLWGANEGAGGIQSMLGEGGETTLESSEFSTSWRLNPDYIYGWGNESCSENVIFRLPCVLTLFQPENLIFGKIFSNLTTLEAHFARDARENTIRTVPEYR